MQQTWCRGSRVEVTALFRDRAGALVDPDAVRVRVREPGGTEQIYSFGSEEELAQVGPGHYRLELDLDQVGEWVVRVESDGVGKAAAELVLTVAPSRFD